MEEDLLSVGRRYKDSHDEVYLASSSNKDFFLFNESANYDFFFINKGDGGFTKSNFKNEFGLNLYPVVD